MPMMVKITKVNISSRCIQSLITDLGIGRVGAQGDFLDEIGGLNASQILDGFFDAGRGVVQNFSS